MAATPTVSVIMTVYNGERTVGEAIESILRQTFRDFEFVIVDDGSDDRTPEILARFLPIDPRLKVVRKPRIGRSKALNVAWKNAVGAYVANLDADDTAEPDRLAKQVAFLNRHPEVGVLGSACRMVYEGYRHAEKLKATNPLAQPPLTDSELRDALVRRNPFVHSSVMMRKEALEEIGGYDEAKRISIDYDLCVRLARCRRIASLPDPLIVRRVSTESYFHRNVSPGERHRSHIGIRWDAWRGFSGRVSDLRFVLYSIARWGYSAIRASKRGPRH